MDGSCSYRKLWICLRIVRINTDFSPNPILVP